MKKMEPKYLLGLFFILCVAIIWAGSSVLVQFIYNLSSNQSSNDDNDSSSSTLSPFLVTYIGVSLFTLWLPAQALIVYVREHCCSTNSDNNYNNNESGEEDRIRSTVEYQTVPSPDLYSETEELEDNNNNNEHDEYGNHHNDRQTTPTPTLFWTRQQHITTALKIAPVWFFANWAYNASLAYTSITASTVLASTGSLFTFLFALALRDEKFACLKLIGVILGVMGSIFTALNDKRKQEEEEEAASQSSSSSAHPYGIWGDILALLSAVGYGGYAVQTRVLCPHDESLYSMQTVLGYIGLINMVALSPLAIYQLLWKNGMSWITLGFLVIKGLLDNVLSDYLWLRAVILTNATVATVGLGLTIPLAFASDIVLGYGDDVLSSYSLAGAVAILIAFIAVNVANNNEDPQQQEHDHDHDSPTTLSPLESQIDLQQYYRDDKPAAIENEVENEADRQDALSELS